VSVNFITQLRAMAHGDYELELRDGQLVALSRRYKQLLPDSIRERI
jgi:DNA-binding LytR/AlgR family response regulator